jgi:hypothetical protein
MRATSVYTIFELTKQLFEAENFAKGSRLRFERVLLSLYVM